MNLNKNEKKVLMLLINNARINDSSIAKKLNISSQAVGKIRKKLEKTVISSYTTNLNYSKLGIQTFAIALAQITKEGIELGELETEQKLLNTPNILQVYRLPNANTTHIILYGFKDIDELDNFFHAIKNKNNIHKFVTTTQLFTFSHNSIIKNNPAQLFQNIINETEKQSKKKTLKELENFKKRLSI